MCCSARKTQPNRRLKNDDPHPPAPPIPSKSNSANDLKSIYGTESYGSLVVCRPPVTAKLRLVVCRQSRLLPNLDVTLGERYSSLDELYGIDDVLAKADWTGDGSDNPRPLLGIEGWEREEVGREEKELVGGAKEEENFLFVG